MHKNVILMGPPGSGKGTQAKNLAEKLGAVYFGTGDLMRLEMKNQTVWGQKFSEVIGRHEGQLVPDDLVENFIKEKFNEVDFGQGIIFDGFPRTIRQAKFLEEFLVQKNEDFIVLDIEVLEESLIERMATRRICEDCGKIFFRPEANGITVCDRCGGKLIRREEDQPEVVKKRLEVYEHETKPLIEYFQAEKKLITVDGEPPIEEVEKEITELIRGKV